MKSFGICRAYVSIRIEFGHDVLPEKCVGVCRDYLICYIQLKLDEWFEHAMVRMTTLTSRGNNQSNWRIKSITGSRRNCICDATWLDVIGGTIVVLVELLLAFGFFQWLIVHTFSASSPCQSSQTFPSLVCPTHGIVYYSLVVD
jgi:hypothetical protein